MPVHDWTRVSAGTFHDFHSAWIIHLKEELNGGLLPEGFYAMAEQQAGRMIADVLTLEVGEHNPFVPGGPGPIAVAVAPPRVRRKAILTPNAASRATRRTLAIRHVSNHRLIALLEILSPANKDRPASVNDFVTKADSALRHGLHLLVLDLFPPGPHDPGGINGAVCEQLDAEFEPDPPDKPLTLAAYLAGQMPEVYLENIAVGDVLPEMPLFLDLGWYVNVPLETTYQAAYRGVPAFWRGVVEGRETPPAD